MKILMSAFACCPGEGSEQGVGWNWALEAGRLGHDVTVLTQTKKRGDIERALGRGEMPKNVSFDFFMPNWLQRLYDLGLRTGQHGLTRQIVHLVWQIAAYFHVRRNLDQRDYDIIHHVTYGGIRHPTLLGHLGIPLVLGPLGGGERAPMALRKSFPWRGWIADLVRDMHTFALRFDPITLSACSKALAIYTITEETKQALPKRFHAKTKLEIEIGLRSLDDADFQSRQANAPLRLIYAGRMLYWKGMGLGLRALARARAAGADIRLSMVGAGPEEAAWRQLSDDLGLTDAVDWRGWTAQDELAELYRRYDALLFPSLHDSSGNVVLEAFARGLPVICLALGGPAGMVTPGSGRAVAAIDRDERDCVAGLAEAMSELAHSPETLANLSQGALARARQFGWSELVARVYHDVEQLLDARATHAPSGRSTLLEAGSVKQ